LAIFCEAASKIVKKPREMSVIALAASGYYGLINWKNSIYTTSNSRSCGAVTGMYYKTGRQHKSG
jgi:hypothetical protein